MALPRLFTGKNGKVLIKYIMLTTKFMAFLSGIEAHLNVDHSGPAQKNRQ